MRTEHPTKDKAQRRAELVRKRRQALIKAMKEDVRIMEQIKWQGG